MVDDSLGAIALISIHPRFADAILAGTKRVEFRKVCFKREISHALLYATAPVQKVVGYVEITEIDERSPEALWRRYREVAGIERQAFFAYYRGKVTGVALKVRRPRRLAHQLALGDVQRGATPPQSFVYSTMDVLRRVAEPSLGRAAARTRREPR